MKNIFISGATGLLGSQILKKLLFNPTIRLIVLIREKNELKAIQKFNKYLLSLNIQEAISCSELKKRIKICCGDISVPRMGLADKEYRSLCDSINEIYHIAALTGFNHTLEEVRLVNVGGTRNMLDFALNCSKFSKFNYISSTFVAGDFEGDFHEDLLSVKQHFNNPYEQSKFEAEKLVKSYVTRGLRIAIYRPSIVVGSSDGVPGNFSGLVYQFYRLLSSGIFKELPIDKEITLNIIPNNFAADMIIFLSNLQEEERDTYHILNTKDVLASRLVRFFCKILQCEEPKAVGTNNFELSKLSKVQQNMLIPFIPYFRYKAKYSFERTKVILSAQGFKFPDLKEKLLLQQCIPIRR